MEEDFPPDEEYDRQCGEIFLTIKGELLIHCTLCEIRYKGFDEYSKHVSKVHCPQKDAECFDIEEFLILSDKRNDDSFFDCYDLDNNGYGGHRTKELFLLNDPNDETNLESEEFKIQSDTPDDFTWKTDEMENLLDNFEDVPLPKPFKYRFNASRKPKKIQNKPAKQDRKYYCLQCDYSCFDKSNFISHVNRHSAYKPYGCDCCVKAFYTRSELQTHKRSHTGERPFLCANCGKGFTTSSKLSSHIKIHTNGQDKECLFCDMKFSTYTALRRHATVHNMENPFKCANCDASFKLAKSLDNHMKIHVSIFEFK